MKIDLKQMRSHKEAEANIWLELTWNEIPADTSCLLDIDSPLPLTRLRTLPQILTQSYERKDRVVTFSTFIISIFLWSDLACPIFWEERFLTFLPDIAAVGLSFVNKFNCRVLRCSIFISSKWNTFRLAVVSPVLTVCSLVLWQKIGQTLVFTSRHNITENTALLSFFPLISHTSTSPTASSLITDQWSTSTIQHFLKALLALQCSLMNDGTRDRRDYQYAVNYIGIMQQSGICISLAGVKTKLWWSWSKHL